MRTSDVILPEIEARFASTEYPRFLSQLAREAGIGAAWDNYQESCSAYIKALRKQINANRDPEWPFGPNKKERRRAKKKARREGRYTKPEQNPEIQILKQRVQETKKAIEETKKAVEELSTEEPIVEFLLARIDVGEFDGDACRRIGPRIRSIAENWEPAPKGYVSWREHALEIANAMEIAVEHPDVVFGICG